jgi:Ser/Thr protein kinase RdoA (MazF antagonist)
MDQVEDDINDMETDVRSKIDIADQRFENKRGQLQNDYDAKADSLRTEADRKNESLRADVERALKELEARLNKRLQRALDNPLAQ